MARAYHRDAEAQAVSLRRAHVRMLIGTSVGFGVGLALVAVIWRVVLGYQRRLIQQADRSEHQALHDPLTGLPNRALFARRLSEAVRAAEAAAAGRGPGDRAGGEPVQLALMVIDLNGFKAVNDTLGHPAGDQLLIETGRRLTQAARRGDVVARLGGDEFAVLLPDVPDADTAWQVGQRLAEALRENFLLDDGPAAVSGSVGIALSPDTRRGGGAHAARRRRHVPGQGRPRWCRHLRRRGGRRAAGPDAAVRRPARPAVRRRPRRSAPPALPAAGQPERRLSDRRGGADPLAAPGPGAAPAGGLPADRRDPRPGGPVDLPRAGPRRSPGRDLAAPGPVRSSSR